MRTEGQLKSHTFTPPQMCVMLYYQVVAVVKKYDLLINLVDDAMKMFSLTKKRGSCNEQINQ